MIPTDEADDDNDDVIVTVTAWCNCNCELGRSRGGFWELGGRSG